MRVTLTELDERGGDERRRRAWREMMNAMRTLLAELAAAEIE
jgi:hypothetical protein